MIVLAAALAGIFGVVHLLGSPSPSAPPAERGSGEPGAIPSWARILWRIQAAAVLALAVLVGVVASVVTVALLLVAMLDLAVLAVLNGVWMHGQPTVIHHVARFSIIAVVGALAVMAL